ncbi:MAG: cobyric acid synthase, partial [Spirochaetaceae bacterium]|nr:cobyric acid synthase [Spirochaetaceae bacterium]
GKSLVVAALCRIFRQDGYRVAPFKSQNMALNSYITKEGLEMGRAQVVQAEAAGIEPRIDMNPVLLKPTSDTKAQVIVQGEVFHNLSAADYYAYKQTLAPKIQESFERLSADFDILVLEGAGSPAEINLRENDIVNMYMARLAASPVLLVGDIDRGGVFASIAGTLLLFTPEERRFVKGLLINKFRGNIALLEPGLRQIEELTGAPVLGVIPYLPVDIDDEDSLSERFKSGAQGASVVDIAVIRLPHIANFTDFNALSRIPGAGVRYVDHTARMGAPDLLVIPGTKNTMADLLWLREQGFETPIKALHQGGTPVFGICGGYQMLGKSLADPYEVEHGGTMAGLGLLDAETVFTKEKTRTSAEGVFAPLGGVLAPLSGKAVAGYEVHMGATRAAGAPPLAYTNGKPDGAFKNNVYGTYIHGIFDLEGPALFKALQEAKGALCPHKEELISFHTYKETQYDNLAEGFRSHVDMGKIYAVLEEGA